MSKYFLSVFAIGLLLLAGACTPKIVPNRPVVTKAPEAVEKAPIKNIILLIGDGMGMAQVSTRFYFQGKEETSNFNRFRYIGLHENQPAGAKVTDSAAGATAFATGYKSYNGAIGVNADSVAQSTIAEIASREGKATGMIATSSITHATPASFYAHVKSRNLAEAIALDLADSSIDFFAGGGQKYFSQRTDGINLVRKMEQKDFVINTTALPKSKLDINKKYGFLLAEDAMPKMQEGRGSFLPDATQVALDYLSQDLEGFFLMVEGSQIDWGGHANDSQYIIDEMRDFDQTIGVALDFAAKQGNTLVIVTADHETGGFSLSAAEIFGKGDYRQISPTFSTGGHSSALIPVFAFGPGAEEYIGIYSNNHLFDKMMTSFEF